MNKILHITRAIKGYSEKQMAEILGIAETEYIEIEHSVADLTASQALKLSKLFNVDPVFYMSTEAEQGRIEKKAAEEIAKILNDTDFQNPHPKLGLDIIRLGNAALSLTVELKHALQREYILIADNKALKKLNEGLKKMILEQQG